MGAPVLNGPFTMSMFRDFVPRKLQPWIYVFMAVTFQRRALPRLSQSDDRQHVAYARRLADVPIRQS